jgi:virginiamycin A acetyltransferase
VDSSKSPELRICFASRFLFLLSRLPKVRRVCLKLALWLEGGAFYSKTARDILCFRYGLTIGAYSYGGCFVPGQFPRGVTIGRYVSIADGVSVLLRNHPLDRLSTHPFFFNRRLGYLPKDAMTFTTLAIGDDVWIGERVIFTPGCNRVGTGAVIGAGAVVTKDVPDFAIVGGNPARLIRYRFSEDTRRAVLASRWWELSVEKCAKHMEAMTSSLESTVSSHPLLQTSEKPAFSSDRFNTPVTSKV